MALTSIELPGQRPRARELYDFLRDAILDGRLEPGERLVEEAIAATARVSRTPVREAIRQLEADRLVEDIGSGMVVVGLSHDELAELCVVRESLEGLACRLAVMHASEMDVLSLQGVMRAWQDGLADGDLSQLVKVNHAFHEMIWAISRNRYLSEQLRTLRDRVERSQETTLTSAGRAHQAMEEHMAMIDAIVRREPDEAEELGRAHMRRAMAIRLTKLRLSTVTYV